MGIKERPISVEDEPFDLLQIMNGHLITLDRVGSRWIAYHRM
jgi:hypothetical protein